MELASLIISIVGVLLGIAGIIVSIYCWRHAWTKIVELRMRKNDFSQEGDLVRFHKDAITHIRESGESPFQFDGNLLNDTKTALYNMLYNILHHIDNNSKDT